MTNENHSTARGAVNPDMKRLCEAAAKAFPLYDPRDFGGQPSRQEAIRNVVQAILIELGSISSDQVVAGSEEPSHWPWLEAILDTKARRAVALQNLADIDRDLL